MDPIVEKYAEQIRGSKDFGSWLGSQPKEELKQLLIALVKEARRTRERLASLEAQVQDLQSQP